mmetsp:Transcript_13896/g.30261  ORF Transcript_13896/g.30261 Transcript_13896/m.30261 type:complete len:202 (-) Transcript_13896:155-760(-)
MSGHNLATFLLLCFFYFSRSFLLLAPPRLLYCFGLSQGLLFFVYEDLLWKRSGPSFEGGLWALSSPERASSTSLAIIDGLRPCQRTVSRGAPGLAGDTRSWRRLAWICSARWEMHSGPAVDLRRLRFVLQRPIFLIACFSRVVRDEAHPEVRDYGLRTSICSIPERLVLYVLLEHDMATLCQNLFNDFAGSVIGVSEAAAV